MLKPKSGYIIEFHRPDPPLAKLHFGGELKPHALDVLGGILYDEYNIEQIYVS